MAFCFFLCFHYQNKHTAITDPSSRKPSTLVLGDGNPFNGCIEKFRKEASGTCNYQCTSRDTDYIEAGEAILLRNLDSQCRERKIDTRNNARDFSKQSASRPPPLYFDGSDIVYSSFPIAMTKIEIPGQQGGNLAGGVEITDSKNYGTTFTIPVGRDSDPSAQNKRTPGGPKYNDAFELSEAHVMASQDFTRVELRDVDGTLVGNPVTLQKGESHVFSNVKKGQQVVAKSPVQVDLITGDLRCTHRANVYEMRWFALTPDRDRSNTYVTPVSTDGTDTTSKFVIIIVFFFVGLVNFAIGSLQRPYHFLPNNLSSSYAVAAYAQNRSLAVQSEHFSNKGILQG